MLITKILNAERENVEGMGRNVPCSKEKGIGRSAVLCLKVVIRLKIGIVTDDRMIEKIRSFSEMKDLIEETSAEEKELLNAADIHGMK